MELNNQDIRDFIEAYTEDTGVVLNDAEALDLAVRFSSMMDVVFRPKKVIVKK